jgi:hypothetical protein
MIARRLVLAATLALAACAAPASEPRSPSTTSTPAPAKESVASPPAPPSGGMPASAGGSTTSDTAPPTTTGASPTGGEAKPGTMAPSPPTVPPPVPTPTPFDDVPHAQAKFEESAQLFTNAGTDCSKMCKALASMERAAGHLCDLVKDGVATDKKKCSDAKARLDHARDRVMSTCGGCD